MNGRVVLGVLVAIVLIVGLAGVGVYAYNIGVAQGMIDSGKAPVPVAPAPYAYPFYGPFSFHPFGWGFGFLGCLFPLLFFLLFFSLIRLIVWGPRWRWHHYRRWDRDERDVPPMVEEWHRKMHEQPTQQK
jgi:hypothetical protein